MTVIHLIRVQIDTNALARWAGERGWIGSRRGTGFDEGRALHHLLAETLGPGSVSPFRLLVPPRSTIGNLYAYSEMDADDLRITAEACAFPDHLRVLSLAKLESKPMPTAWRAGQSLGFDLRCRPVRRLPRDLVTPTGRVSRGSEIDAFLLEALRRHPDEPTGMATEGRTREAVYLDWLAEQIGSTAELDLDSSQLIRFRRIRVLRNTHAIEGPDSTIHGTLTISKPGEFTRLLQRGIGRHRAYGYGMLLLRPPQKPAPIR